MNANCHFSIRFFQLLLLALLAATPARAAFTVLDYWRMGENDPRAVSGGSCTNITDGAGGLTLTNTPHLSVYPVYTNSVSATAAAATGSQLALQFTAGQFAVGNVISNLQDNFGLELWVKSADTSSTKILAYNGNTSTSGWGLYQSGSVYRGLFGGLLEFGSATVTPNVWTHLALVRAGGLSTLYINGVSAGTAATTPNSPAGNFLIGANNLQGENFAGALDEVRVFTFGTGEFNVTNLLYFQTPSFILSSTNFSVGASAGTNTVNLSVTPTNVSWAVVPNVSWLHVTNATGTGSATIGFTYDDNPGATRSGTLTIAGQTVTVTQGSPSYSLNGNYDFYWTGDFVEEPSGAGSDSISLTVTPNAGQWSVTSYAGWIHPTNPAGAGSTNISFTFDANTDPGGSARFGLVYINNPSNPNLRLVVVQQAPASGTGQATYRFTGNLMPYLPQYIPTNASAALQSVQSNDVFYVTMTLVPSPVDIYYEVWACAVNNITFSVPSRGLVYSQSFDDLEVLDDANNPNTLRWDVDNVDSTVDMIFWARDFNQTALTSANIPDPLNLSGFHANGFAQIILFNGVGENPELYYGNLVPMPGLSIQQQQLTNAVSWVTSDSFYTPTLQTTFALAPNAVWTDVTNPPVVLGLTNIVTIPATNHGAQFFRLKLL
jgi:hypothetical protein